MPLYPHQETTVDFLVPRGLALLWDEPGVGKTAPTVVAAAAVFPKRVLVACPAIVREMWAREFNRWAPHLPVTVEQGYIKAPPGPGVTILSHANFAMEAPTAALWASAPYDLLIVDEADAFRVFTASRTRNLLFSGPRPDGFYKACRQVWMLTGTPLVNSSADLYPILSGPLRWGMSWWDFCLRFAELRPDASTEFKAHGIKNAAELAGWLRPHVLHRTIASLGIPLPKLEVNQVTLPVPPDAIIHAMAGLEHWNPQRLVAALEVQDELRDPEMSRVRHALGLAKAPYVAQHVKSVIADGGGPAVVFFQHTAVRDLIRDNMPGYQIGIIDGKTSRKKITEAEAALQAGQLHLLLVQTQAGGMGLTLTRSNRAMAAEMAWTATALKQAFKRIHRITQTRECIAEILRNPGCWLEDVFASVVDRKHRASEELLSCLVTNK